MNLNILALVVPVLLFFMLLEYWVARQQGKTYFNFADSVSNLNVGIVDRLLDVFVTGAFYFVYDYLYQHFALWHVQPTWYNWALLLLVTDFIWYWYHRLGHQVNLLWGFHVVHHQSPEFNYTASVRVTVFQAVVRTGFWSALPILGFPAPMITSILILHGLYPFFTHTRVIGRLGWLEYIFVTPSHHRVHHASNEQYLDRNYGDIFIFWDKLFGTFTEEKEEPTFGLTKPLDSYSFLWQHFHFLLEIGYAVRRAHGWRAKLAIVFGKPDDLDPNAREVLERRFRIRKGANRIAVHWNRYVLGQSAVAMTTLFCLILFEHHLDWWPKVLIAGFVLSTVINIGAILEQRQWIFRVELLRAVVLAAALLTWFPMLLTVLMGASVLVVVYYQSIKQQYLRLVYRA